MSRLKFLLPAAALMLAGAVTSAPAQAAPALPGAIEAAASAATGIDQVHWRHRYRFNRWHNELSDRGLWHWRRHRHHHHHGDRHHHRRDHHHHHRRHDHDRRW
jgi:hypothetical protein